jgi:hypothetical protein
MNNTEYESPASSPLSPPTLSSRPSVLAWFTPRRIGELVLIVIILILIAALGLWIAQLLAARNPSAPAPTTDGWTSQVETTVMPRVNLLNSALWPVLLVVRLALSLGLLYFLFTFALKALKWFKFELMGPDQSTEVARLRMELDALRRTVHQQPAHSNRQLFVKPPVRDWATTPPSPQLRNALSRICLQEDRP